MSESSYPAGFWAVWTAVVVDLLGFGIIIPILPLYADSFGASPWVVGVLFASYSLAQFVFSPVWGRVSDRIGRRPVLLVTILGSAVGSLILGMAGSLAMLFVGRIVDGVSGASVAVARATVADTASAEQRSRLMGLLGAAFGIGFVVGPVLGGLAALAGPAVPFFLAAGISIANFGYAYFRLPETRTAASSEATGGVGSLSSTVVRLVILTFVGIASFSAFEATFALLGEARLEATPSTIAWAMAAVGLVLVATQGGLVNASTRRLGETGTLRIGLAANVVGFAVTAIATDWVTLGAGVALLAIGQGLFTPTLASAIAGAVPPGKAGAVLGVQQSANGLARVIGPALGGVLFGIGLSIPYWFGAVVALLALVIVPRTERLEALAVT